MMYIFHEYYAPIKKLSTVHTRNSAYEKKTIYLKKEQLVLAQTQVPPFFPFSPKNSHFQKLNFEK